VPIEFKVNFPSTVEQFWARCSGNLGFRRLQSKLVGGVWKQRYQALVNGFKPKSSNYARLVGLGNPYVVDLHP